MTYPTEIYLDCDGVLANFGKAACEIHDWSPDVITKWAFYEDQGMSAEDFWRPITARGAEFALSLEAFPWAPDLYRLCTFTAPTTVLTAPWANAMAWGGRALWLEKFGVPSDRMILANSRYKARLATANSVPNILIDDSEDNIEAFCLAGGVGLLWPGPANALRDHLGILDRYPDQVLFALKHAIRLTQNYGMRADRVKWLRNGL